MTVSATKSEFPVQLLHFLGGDSFTEEPQSQNLEMTCSSFNELYDSTGALVAPAPLYAPLGGHVLLINI